MEEKQTTINLGGLWIQESKNGDSYLAGTLGGARIMIFKNSRKTEDKHPDYRIVLAPYVPREKKEVANAQADVPF